MQLLTYQASEKMFKPSNKTKVITFVKSSWFIWYTHRPVAENNVRIMRYYITRASFLYTWLNNLLLLLLGYNNYTVRVFVFNNSLFGSFRIMLCEYRCLHCSIEYSNKTASKLPSYYSEMNVKKIMKTKKNEHYCLCTCYGTIHEIIL